MKKIISLLLSALIVFGAMPFVAFADIHVEDGGDGSGGFGDNTVEIEDTLEDPDLTEPSVTIQDDITKVENLDSIVSDATKNIIYEWGDSSQKDVSMTICTSYTSGTTVDKVFQTSKIATMTNGIINETHGDLGGHRWFDSNKEYVEGYVDLTFNFPVAATINNFLLASTTESVDRRTWEYQIYAANELDSLYTEANLLYHYNKDGENTPTVGQYLTFAQPITAKYFGLRVLDGCNPNSDTTRRSYANIRIREMAIIGSCVIPDEYKATGSKWINVCLDDLDTDYNLLNGDDYVSGDGSAGTIVSTAFDGSKTVSSSIRSYNPDACDLVDHLYTELHADVTGVNFMNSDGTYKEGAYINITVALLHEATIDKFFISHATSNHAGLRTYEYEVYAGNDMATLYNEENKKWHFVNENAVQHQVYEFKSPITAKYVGVKLLKGVMPDCTLPNSSCARIAEIALFGEYNTDYYDYSVTSGEAGLVSASGNAYKGKKLSFSAPLCEGGYTLRGWTINGEPMEYTADRRGNIASVEFNIKENSQLQAVYTPDDTEFTSNDTYVVSKDKTLIRVPVHSVVYELRNGFEQYHQNISAKRGEASLEDKNFIKSGDSLILSSNGTQKQSLSVVIAGDCNYDSAVTVTDVVSGIDTILGGTTTLDKFHLLDLNNSNSITVTDIIYIRKTILTTPAEETDYENSTTNMGDLDYKTQGRYVVNANGSVIFDWTASGFSFNADLYGDVVLNVTQGPNDSRWYTAVIDGVEHEFTINGNSTQDVIIAKDLSSGIHSIGFYKQQEGGNTITVNSVTINGKVLSSDAENDLLIEFIGDSITCGAGNLLENGKETGVSHTQNGYNSYGTVTARLLDADWSNISVSGSSLIDDRQREPSRNHMPTEYKNAITGSKPNSTDTPAWDFESNRNADIVVINLGTNDNGFISHYAGNDTAAKTEYFKNLAVDFANQIIAANGEDVKIVFAFGMMTREPNFADAAYQAAVEELAAGGYTNAYYCRLPTDTTGGYAHPTVAGDFAAAEVLSDFIKDTVLAQ